jgi:hypothetical protein
MIITSNISFNLPALKVSKELLTEVEDFIIKEANKVYGDTSESIPTRYKVIFEGKNITEMKSINEYRSEMLPDDIKKIELGLNIYYLYDPDKLSINLSITKGLLGGNLRIISKGENPEEYCQLLLMRFKKIIEPFKQRNLILLQSIWLWLICILVYEILRIGFDALKPFTILLSLFSFFYLLAGVIYLPLWAPKLEFETKKQKGNRTKRIAYFSVLGIIIPCWVEVLQTVMNNI